MAELDNKHSKLDSKQCLTWTISFRNGQWQEEFEVDKFPTVLCLVPTSHSRERIAARIRESQGLSGVTYYLKAWTDLFLRDVYEGWYHATTECMVNLMDW